MRIKFFQFKSFYIRLDLPLHGNKNILLGIDSAEGTYEACTDPSRTDCIISKFAEFRVGVVIFTLAFGVEKPIFKINRNVEEQDDTQVQ